MPIGDFQSLRFWCTSKFGTRLGGSEIGDLKIPSTSTERQKHSQNLAPVLVIISGNSLVLCRKFITSTGFRVSTSSGKKSVSHEKLEKAGTEDSEKKKHHNHGR